MRGFSTRHPDARRSFRSKGRGLPIALALAFFSVRARAQDTGPPPSARSELDVGFFGGVRSFGSEWDPVASPPAIGFEVKVRPKTWQLRLKTEFVLSSQKRVRDAVDLEVTVVDFGLGIEFPFRLSPRTELWIGGGVTRIKATATFGGFFQSEDNSVAAFAGAGFTVRVGPGLLLGLEGRWLTGSSLRLATPSGGTLPSDANYVQFGAMVGWRW